MNRAGARQQNACTHGVACNQPHANYSNLQTNRMLPLLRTHLLHPTSSLGPAPPASAAAREPCKALGSCSSAAVPSAHCLVLSNWDKPQAGAKQHCPCRPTAALASLACAATPCHLGMGSTTQLLGESPAADSRHQCTANSSSHSLLDAGCQLRRLRRLLLLLPLLLRLGGPLGLVCVHLQRLEAQGDAHPAGQSKGVGGV